MQCTSPTMSSSLSMRQLCGDQPDAGLKGLRPTLNGRRSPSPDQFESEGSAKEMNGEVFAGIRQIATQGLLSCEEGIVSRERRLLSRISRTRATCFQRSAPAASYSKMG